MYHCLQGGMATVYVDEDGYPITPTVRRGKKKKNTLYPTDDIDDRHLHAVGNIFSYDKKHALLIQSAKTLKGVNLSGIY